jgi:hypothetical protein
MPNEQVETPVSEEVIVEKDQQPESPKTEETTETPVEKPRFGVLNRMIFEAKNQTPAQPVLDKKDEEKKDSPEVKEVSQKEEKPKEDKPKEEKTPEVSKEFKYKSYEELPKEELIKVTKSFQSRHDKIASDLEKSGTIVNELQSRLKWIIENPAEFIKKVAPELEFGVGEVAEENLDRIISHWQQTDLIRELAKKYPTEVVEGWEPNEADVRKVGTASFDFVSKTLDKQRELRDRVKQTSEVEAQREQYDIQMAEVIRDRNAQDMEWLSNTYNVTKEEFSQWDKEIEEMLKKSQQTGDLYPELHPNRLKNVLRGLFFDKFLEKKLQGMIPKEEHEKILANVHKQYADKIGGKKQFIPPSSPKSGEVSVPIIEKDQKRYVSPMERSKQNFKNK